VIPDPGRCGEADDRDMTLTPATTRVPVGAALIAGTGAQLLDGVTYVLLPPAAPLSGLIAILLTAGAARIVTRARTGSAVARTGLAVGAVSAGIGLLIGGLGIIAILLAAITVVAGVAGAVAGRHITDGPADV
jgi:hypothetical protein